MTLRKAALFLGIALILAACRNVGESYLLKDGETLEGDQHVVAVDVELEAGSTIYGDLNITASRAQINSLIRGDLTLVASELNIGADAVIQGDFIYCLVNSGQLSIHEEAVIWGETHNNCTGTTQSTVPEVSDKNSSILWLGSTFFFSLATGFLASMGTLFFPRQMRRTGMVAHEHPAKATGFGFFTLLMALGLSTLFSLSLEFTVPLILAPFVVGAWLIMLILTIFGVISAAQPFGVWLMRLFKRDEHVPLITAMVGASVMTFLVLIFNVVGSLGFLTTIAVLGIASWGLGAALLTRAGTQFYRRTSKDE